MKPRAARDGRTPTTICSIHLPSDFAGALASPLHAHHGDELSDLAGQAGMVGGVHHGGDVLVGARGLLGDAAQGGAADEDAA